MAIRDVWGRFDARKAAKVSAPANEDVVKEDMFAKAGIAAE